LNDSKEAKEAVEFAYSSGHQIASHTWSHKDLNVAVSDGTFDSELVKLEQVTQDIIGVR
jgi:peptidoglycan/xylan/chitin deacetylase (PgdA/CDA1 family)